MITPVPPTPVTTMPYGPVEHGQLGLGQDRERHVAGQPRTLRSRPPLTVTKLGQKPLRQVKSLLQADWSIRRLRPSSVSLRLDGDAVAGDAAVAAALADQLVDDHPLVGVGEGAALAAAALLGGTGLVVDQGGDARHLAQAALHRVELVAVVDADARARTRRPAGTCPARR